MFSLSLFLSSLLIHDSVELSLGIATNTCYDDEDQDDAYSKDDVIPVTNRLLRVLNIR